MNKPLGVIDLGTNTFHLLIAHPGANGVFDEVYRERRFIKLAEGGIELIDDQAFQRGLEALQAYRAVLDQHEVSQVRAIGTAALRTAVNGREFIRRAELDAGLKVEVIDGAEEARLIHLGVSHAVPLELEVDLIMDIGGGSVEFILANRDKVFWSQSFPVGVAVLYHRYHRHEPILPVEVRNLEVFLDRALHPLRAAIRRYPVRRLIGASGTFDVLENFLAGPKAHPLRAQIPLTRYEGLHHHILGLHNEARHQLEGLPPERADMIVVALILLRKVLHLADVDHMMVSAYAMKEGMLSEMAGGGS